jgi:hypothetical protein
VRCQIIRSRLDYGFATARTEDIFAPAYTGIGGPASIPTIRLKNTFNPVASFTNLRGNHTLKFGSSTSSAGRSSITR